MDEFFQDSPTDLEGLEVMHEDRFGGHMVPFTRSHVPLEQFTNDVTQSLKRTFPTESRRYDNVHVLLLRWAEDDLGTKREIEDLEKVFRETYHYTTECATIPSDDSHNTLEFIITRFRQSYDSSDRPDSPCNLLILYYGGHGVRKSDNKSIWAAKGSLGSPSVDWSEIQPILLRAHADVLFLLDCCYASSAGTRGASDGAKEVLAACSMEDVTTGVHDNSFTRILIEELLRGAKKGLTTWELNGQLMRRRVRDDLKYTPRHFPLLDAAGAKPRIELRPLRSSSELHPEHDPHGSHGDITGSELATPSLAETASTLPTEDEDMFFENRILLSINLKDWTIPPSVAEWSGWLRGNAPSNIQSIIARFHRPTHQRAIDKANDAQNPRTWAESVHTFEDPGRKERVDKVIVRSESAFDSHSTLLLVSIPLSLWTFLPDNPAYSFVGLITSRNRLTSRGPSRTNSMSELAKVAVDFDRQHWWYKWLFGLAFFAVISRFVSDIPPPLITVLRTFTSDFE